jgi:hypothetical protein
MREEEKRWEELVLEDKRTLHAEVCKRVETAKSNDARLDRCIIT